VVQREYVVMVKYARKTSHPFNCQNQILEKL